MTRYTCYACKQGHHDLCAGRQPPPPGVFGGSECDCDGKCAERSKQTTDDQVSAFLDALRTDPNDSSPSDTRKRGTCQASKASNPAPPAPPDQETRAVS
jgi:hypothetical protein